MGCGPSTRAAEQMSAPLGLDPVITPTPVSQPNVIVDLQSSQEGPLQKFIIRNIAGDVIAEVELPCESSVADAKSAILAKANLTEQDVRPPRASQSGFHSFRIQNLGAPNHLCCSGIEFYGILTPCVSISLMQGEAVMPDTASILTRPSTPSETPVELTAVLTDRAFNFGSVSRDCFDTNGVLYAFGTNFGKEKYQSPVKRGVNVKFSPDANNFYSQRTGHQVGNTTAALEIILSHQHPGSNATMWSQGAANAWFQIDLPEGYLLELSHYCYRGDYGGGENHPRTWALQGSVDGENWVTLRSHSNEQTPTMHQAGSWSVSVQ